MHALHHRHVCYMFSMYLLSSTSAPHRVLAFTDILTDVVEHSPPPAAHLLIVHPSVAP